MELENKIALVTGAAGGIGLATAKRLMHHGVGGIGLVDRSPSCIETAKRLNALSGSERARAFCGDVTDPGFRRSVFDGMRTAFGSVQICIPAAGVIADSLGVKVDRHSGDVALYPESTFKRLMEINLNHPTYWALETIGGLARKRFHQGLGKWESSEGVQGVVILVGSVSSRGQRGQVAYAGAKSGLIGIASTLNLEGLYHGVQTKIIHPGFVDTPMVDSIDSDYFEKHFRPRIGLGRKIQPDEIGEIICTMIRNPALSGEVWADASLT